MVFVWGLAGKHALKVGTRHTCTHVVRIRQPVEHCELVRKALRRVPTGAATILATCFEKFQSLRQSHNKELSQSWGKSGILTHQTSLYRDSRATRDILLSLFFNWDRHMVRKYGQLLRKNCFWLTHSRHVTSGNRCCRQRNREQQHLI